MMNKRFGMALAGLLVLALCGQAMAARGDSLTGRWVWANGHEKLHTLDDRGVEAALAELNRRFPDPDDRLLAIARMRLGTPYLGGCLGEERPPDSDPIFRLDKVDCTVFVITSAALLHADDLARAREVLVRINYRARYDEAGNLTYPVSFENRVHFTSDRIRSSTYFRNISEAMAGPDKVERRRVVLNRGDDGEPLLDIGWERELELVYVPARHVEKELLDRLPKAVNVAFVRERMFARGLDVVHEGLLFAGWELIHASSAAGELVSVRFLDYMFPSPDKPPRYDGVVFAAIH